MFQVNFIFFLFLDIFLIVCIEFPSVFTPSNSSDAFLTLVKGFQRLKQVNILWILLVIRLLLRLLWLLSTPTLFIGNRLEKCKYMSPWQVMAVILILYSALTSAYFLVIHYECGFIADIGRYMAILSSQDGKNSEYLESGREVARFVLFFTLFEGVVLFFLPNVIFLVCVHLRITQIKYSKKETRLLESWTSYELQPFRIPRARMVGDHRSDADAGLSTISRGLSATGATTVRLAHTRNSAPVHLPSLPSFSNVATHVPANMKNNLSQSQYLYENRAFESESDCSDNRSQSRKEDPRLNESQQHRRHSSQQSSTLKRAFL